MTDLNVKWDKIIKSNSPTVSLINLTNGTMFNLISFYSGTKLFVGIERRGCFLFSTDREIHIDYAAEKLNLWPADAAIIADWINAQLGFDAKQQGNYTRAYLLDNEILGCSILDILKPLVPKIIS